MTEYLYQAPSWDGDPVMRYPESRPFMQRDQGARAADDTIRVVIGDISDVLRAAGYIELSREAGQMYAEACACWEEGSDSGWADVDDDASERLQWILEAAEQLEHIVVDWDGDAGTVTVTIAEYWEECPAGEVPKYL